jgi:hypothetical protein
VIALLAAPRTMSVSRALPATPVLPSAWPMPPPTAAPIPAMATPFQSNLSWIPVATPTAWLAALPAAPETAPAPTAAQPLSAAPPSAP